MVDLSKHLVKPGLYFISIPDGWPCTYRVLQTIQMKLILLFVFSTLPQKCLEGQVADSMVFTGSTIRNCDKVKTWLDQMFWQIYQKLMLSGFLSSGNLCLIQHLKLFWPHAASTASDKKGAKTQHEFSQFFFSKHQTGTHWASVFGRFVKTFG